MYCLFPPRETDLVPANLTGFPGECIVADAFATIDMTSLRTPGQIAPSHLLFEAGTLPCKEGIRLMDGKLSRALTGRYSGGEPNPAA